MKGKPGTDLNMLLYMTPSWDLPAETGSLSKLRVSTNNFTQLPPEIRSLHNIAHLNLTEFREGSKGD